MGKELNYYELLGVPPDAGTDEIQKAYRRKAKIYHPDKNGGSDASSDLFKRLGEAKEVLMDEQKRLAYDYSIGVKKKEEPRPQPEFQRQDAPRAEPQNTGSSSVGAAFAAGIGALAFGALLAWFFSDEGDEAEEEIRQ